uniref:Amino acid transporter n=1 Tax=Globisporangium ultimum (strain ATCC 200006 / CBS 805.95 / DAOM BR144) TaxID=431595 RepID=K3X4X1_GLOUD
MGPSSLHEPPPLSSNALSSLGDLHDHGSEFSLRRSSSSQQRGPQFVYDHESGQELELDDGLLEVRGEVPSSDLSNVNTLHVLIGAAVGVVVAVVISQTSSDENVGDSAAVRWLLLPGKLYMNAMLCVVLPSIFLHSVLGSMHFSTLNKTKALGSKMLILFAVTTIWASVLGVLVALCFTPMMYENQALRSVVTEASVLPRDTALIKLTCPQLSTSNHSSSLLVQQDGSMRCTQPLEDVNGTRFLLDDIAHSFHINAMTQRIPRLSEQVAKVLETVFPVNLLQSFLDGDVLSVILAGMALGVALLHFSSISSVAGTSDSSLLFLLMMQAEVILSVLLGFLLRILPSAIGFIVPNGSALTRLCAFHRSKMETQFDGLLSKPQDEHDNNDGHSRPLQQTHATSDRHFSFVSADKLANDKTSDSQRDDRGDNPPSRTFSRFSGIDANGVGMVSSLTMTMTPTTQFLEQPEIFNVQKGNPAGGGGGPGNRSGGARGGAGGTAPLDDLLVDLHYKSPHMVYTCSGGLAGFALGAVLRKFVNLSTTAQWWIGLPGYLYTNAVQCITIPLIFTSVTICFANLLVSRKTKGVIVRMVIYFVLASFLACCVALGVSFMFTGTFSRKPNLPSTMRSASLKLMCPNGKYLSKQSSVCEGNQLHDAMTFVATNITGISLDSAGIPAKTYPFAAQICHDACVYLN